VTTIDFSTPMQVARGSIVTDADGSRQATIMFPEGTQATMVMPNGATQPLATIDVRATEYTVGESGPKAMPGLLPPTSGYTYAAELSVDEAIAAGAKSVQFDQPIPVYIENFIGFPTGTHVPIASYDKTKSAWVPSTDGRVIEVVGASGGLAQISVDTGGAVADSATLAELGVTNAERQQIASLYSVGQKVWRLPVTHFTAIDGNYPVDSGGVKPDEQSNVGDQTSPIDCGSVIECTTQVLGEHIGLTGVPFGLSYRSERVLGYVSGRSKLIQVTGASLPDRLLRAELELEIAGRRVVQTFAPIPNTSVRFTWDGKDAYGRSVQGRLPLAVRVTYVYPTLYLLPAAVAQSFGLACYGQPNQSYQSACVIPLDTTGLRARGESRRSIEQQFFVGVMDASADKTGAWTIDTHHVYDPIGHTLYLGDGTHRSVEPVLETVAGTGKVGTTGDGGQATQAQLWDPNGIAIAPDGTIYVSDQSFRIRRIAPNGIISTIAGTGTCGRSGDGGQATAAQVCDGPIALGPDGSLYLAHGFGVVRRIAPDGIITTVAGNSALTCPINESPDSLATRAACVRDGGPATDAFIFGPLGIAVGPDGGLYIGDGNYNVRKVSPSGIIETIAGGGHASYPCSIRGDYPWFDTTCGDGGPARQAGFGLPASLAVGADGSVYVADVGNALVRRIAPNGIITRVAGNGVQGYSGDGGPATAAKVNTGGGLAVGADGSLYIADFRRIPPRAGRTPLGPRRACITRAGIWLLAGEPSTLPAHTWPCRAPTTQPVHGCVHR
jgi:hypothetical protein